MRGGGGETTDEFLRRIENAFAHFGGVPRTLIIDNLKAAVARADWYDPELNPKIQSFCRHYGIAILPTRPYTPRHKGKIERGVGYVKGNALKGHTFGSLADQNHHLFQWESQVADRRIHGTTRKQVSKVFEEVEKPALFALPPARFELFHEALRHVNRDGHVQVKGAYYSAPPEYLGQDLWARWDGRTVRLFDKRMTQIAVHVQQEPGRLPRHRLAVTLAAVRQHDAEDPGPAPLSIRREDRRPAAEVHLRLGPRLALHPPKRSGRGGGELADQPPHAVVAAGVTVFGDQVLEIRWALKP